MVPHTCQSFDPSLRGTTSLVPAGASEGWTWCLTPVKALIIRNGAPRHWCRQGLLKAGRGGYHQSKPCLFVTGHHGIGSGRCFGGMDVVPPTRQSLDLSLRGTTSLPPKGRRGGVRRQFFPFEIIEMGRAARRPAEGLRAALLLFKNLNKQYPPVRTESVWMPGCRSCSAHPESDSLPPCPGTAACGTAPEVQRR